MAKLLKEWADVINDTQRLDRLVTKGLVIVVVSILTFLVVSLAVFNKWHDLATAKGTAAVDRLIAHENRPLSVLFPEATTLCLVREYEDTRRFLYKHGFIIENRFMVPELKTALYLFKDKKTISSALLYRTSNGESVRFKKTGCFDTHAFGIKSEKLESLNRRYGYFTFEIIPR